MAWQPSRAVGSTRPNRSVPPFTVDARMVFDSSHPKVRSAVYISIVAEISAVPASQCGHLHRRVAAAGNHAPVTPDCHGMLRGYGYIDGAVALVSEGPFLRTVLNFHCPGGPWTFGSVFVNPYISEQASRDVHRAPKAPTEAPISDRLSRLNRNGNANWLRRAIQQLIDVIICGSVSRAEHACDADDPKWNEDPIKKRHLTSQTEILHLSFLRSRWRLEISRRMPSPLDSDGYS